MDQYLSIDDVAARLQLHRKTVSAAIFRGQLIAFKLGNRYRISEADLAAYLEQRQYHVPKPRIVPDRSSRS